jgi:SAM-dependent methyltransferase
MFAQGARALHTRGKGDKVQCLLEGVILCSDLAMFEKSERFYDAIYAWKDYKAEAARLKRFIATYKQSTGHTFLDVACGTGTHIGYLSDTFTIEGIDINQRMLEIARAKHPSVVFHHGDMVDFDLGRQFDVVASLFSSICYLKTPARLMRAVANMARHVYPGGLLIVEPFFSPATWKPRTKAPGLRSVSLGLPRTRRVGFTPALTVTADITDRQQWARAVVYRLCVYRRERAGQSRPGAQRNRAVCRCFQTKAQNTREALTPTNTAYGIRYCNIRQSRSRLRETGRFR